MATYWLPTVEAGALTNSAIRSCLATIIRSTIYSDYFCCSTVDCRSIRSKYPAVLEKWGEKVCMTSPGWNPTNRSELRFPGRIRLPAQPNERRGNCPGRPSTPDTLLPARRCPDEGPTRPRPYALRCPPGWEPRVCEPPSASRSQLQRSYIFTGLVFGARSSAARRPA